ncbi:hypothetical protein J6590_065782 [Homalodisca vitripennis]|nr:hypothetical protein J6590_065782 [Homalodisca vitripennis]
MRYSTESVNSSLSQSWPVAATTAEKTSNIDDAKDWEEPIPYIDDDKDCKEPMPNEDGELSQLIGNDITAGNEDTQGNCPTEPISDPASCSVLLGDYNQVCILV